MEIRDLEAIRKTVETAKRRPPVADDSKFSAAKDAEVGLPAMVYTPEGKPAFWIVPFLMKDSACGFARVELSRKVSQIGIFGSGPEDRLSWIGATFFEKPPPEMLAEIQTRYSGMAMSKPVLSYDASPGKWAWRMEIRKEDKIKSIVFITPGGWYEQKSDKKVGWEG